MSNKNIQTLKGFRDFLPEEKRARNVVQGKIVETFERFGFEPLETPTLEYASLLLGKYGDEADKLVYSFKDRGDRSVALRYDQTVPSARVLSQYQGKLPKYFRRYQIQNVFRADKPQKGRYREFTQCDIDIFGSKSNIADSEILACSYFAYKNIGFKNIKLNLNDRTILIEALTPFVTDSVDVYSIIQSVDKLDKKEKLEVVAELVEKGLSKDNATKALETLEKSKPSEELSSIVIGAIKLGVPKDSLVFNPFLARGLDYYTGMIFEINLPEYGSGSCGGGGRYDNLINELGGVDVPAVGVAFGFDRTVEAAQSLGLLPKKNSTSKVLVTVFGEKYKLASLASASYLRKQGIATEVYPAIDKLGKQFKYANSKNIPFVIIIGENEFEQGESKVVVKDMTSGNQEIVTIEKAAEILK
ncbi:MAG: histidine--tRNA ligase [Candidatus Pacebacteria bacterium]|nr:histidine--tRNA ligase [Candidatus Paceibacterota bacterium]